MEVREGANGDYGKWKFDVAVDEMDLRRILYAAGWSGRRDHIPAALAFKILQTEAQMFLYHTIASKYDYPAEDAKKKIEAALAEQKSAVKKLLELPSAEPDPFDPEEPSVD